MCGRTAQHLFPTNTSLSLGFNYGRIGVNGLTFLGLGVSTSLLIEI